MTIHVITGPPCAGKSTFVRENAHPGQNECLLRADRDKRPEWTADQIRRWYRRNPTRKSA